MLKDGAVLGQLDHLVVVDDVVAVALLPIERRRQREPKECSILCNSRERAKVHQGAGSCIRLLAQQLNAAACREHFSFSACSESGWRSRPAPK